MIFSLTSSANTLDQRVLVDLEGNFADDDRLAPLRHVLRWRIWHESGSVRGQFL